MKKYSDDDTAIIQAITNLLTAFPGQDFTRENFKGYLSVFQDLPVQHVLDAINGLAAEGREFFPPAGVIKARAFDLRDVGLDIPTAYEAWDAALSKWNPPASKWLDHPLVDKAVRGIGGWTYLGCSSNLMADRARFIEAFDTFRDKEKQMERLPDGVRGRIEARIDEHKAKQVDEAITKLLKGKVAA